MDSAIVVAVVVHAMVGKAMENSSGSSCDKENGDGRQGNKDGGGGSCRFQVKRKKGRQGRKKERKEKERKKKERRKRTKIGCNFFLYRDESKDLKIKNLNLNEIYFILFIYFLYIPFPRT